MGPEHFPQKLPSVVAPPGEQFTPILDPSPYACVDLRSRDWLTFPALTTLNSGSQILAMSLGCSALF
jgi:hypothetical protein